MDISRARARARACSFCSPFLRRVFDRESVLQEQLLLVRLGFFFRLPSSDLGLAITMTSFDTIILEFIGSTLRVDTVRGKPRMWFASVFAAPTIGLVVD